MKFSRQLLWRLWLPAVLLASWEAFARGGLLDPIFFPPPSALFLDILAMTRTGELGVHIQGTLRRTLQGAAIGLFAGVACGILMGASRGFRRSLESPIAAFAATPKIALLPILMLALGIGESPRLALIAAAAFVAAALPVLDGVRNLDSNYVEMAHNYGGRSWKMVTWVYLPGCLPQLLTAARFALNRALAVCITVEVLNASSGLGSLIWSGWQAFRPEHVYIGVLLAALLGTFFHVSMRLLEKALVPWKVQPA